MANLSELKGELLALRCYIGALLQVLPAQHHRAFAPAVQRNAAPLRGHTLVPKMGIKGHARHELRSIARPRPAEPCEQVE